MDIHKPKPVHSWREFFGEILVIVIGVLIAITLDQVVEALRHHGEAREMTRKLHEEALENRHVLTYNLGICHAEIAVADKDIDALSRGALAGRFTADSLAPLPFPNVYQPGNAAWITIRDSALLPIMPKVLVDNAWKIDTTRESMVGRIRLAGDSRIQAQAMILTSRQRPVDVAYANDLILKLNELRQQELSVCKLVETLRDLNEQSIAGKEIDSIAVLQDGRAGAPKAPGL